MSWFKNLFSTPKTDVEMKMSPQEKMRALEKEIPKLEKDSIEKLQKEIEYTKLSYELNPKLIPQQLYEKELARLKDLLTKKMSEQTQKDWNGGAKRTKSKKAKAMSKSKKIKRSKAKPRSRKQKK